MKHLCTTTTRIPATVLSLALLAVFMLSACGGPRPGRVGDDSVYYEDAAAVETVTANYGSTDLQTTAEFMTQSLLTSHWIAEAPMPPRIRLHQIKNYTDEHIDGKGIADKIRIKLMQSGKVRFLADSENLDQVFDERDLTESTTVKAGNSAMAASDYILTGSVRSIRKRSDKLADVFYQITLELVDHQSGEIVWVNEKEIRKVSTKPTVGW